MSAFNWFICKNPRSTRHCGSENHNPRPLLIIIIIIIIIRGIAVAGIRGSSPKIHFLTKIAPNFFIFLPRIPLLGRLTAASAPSKTNSWLRL